MIDLKEGKVISLKGQVPRKKAKEREAICRKVNSATKPGFKLHGLTQVNQFVVYMPGNRTSAAQKFTCYEEQMEKKDNDSLFVAVVAKIFPRKSIFSLIAS